MVKAELNKVIGDNIKKYRGLKNLSQGQLARLLGVNNSYISTLEKGLRNPSVNVLGGIAEALGVSVSDLVELSKYTTSEQVEIMSYVPRLIDKKEKEWLGKEWYHQRFDGCPYLIHMIAEAEITTRRKEKYDLYFDRHFCFFEDGRADWYIDIAEIERVTSSVIRLTHGQPRFSKKLIEEYQPLENAFYSECENIDRIDLSGLSDKELISLHDAFVQKILNRNSSSSIIDGFALGTDRLLESAIKEVYEASKSLKKELSFSEVFSRLTTTSHSSFVREAELELFKLILAIRQNKDDKKKLIRNYRDRYHWIRNNYIDDNMLSTSYFEEEIARIESSGFNVSDEIKRIENLPEENKRKKEELQKKLKLNKETSFLLAITEDFTRWQDERKKATLFTAHYCIRILEEISRRVGIPTDFLKYMSPREVSRVFIDTPPLDVLKERQISSVIYWDHDGHEILSGDEVVTIRRKILGDKKIEDVQDFRGMTASLGKAQGRVRIIKSAKEIHKIEEGDVLVAVMTRPDYILGMKKAVAIITDEGGITSHAAIVSRELDIPCVIGTKIATQILHDGDIVQVNANHGHVKILERSLRK